MNYILRYSIAHYTTYTCTVLRAQETLDNNNDDVVLHVECILIFIFPFHMTLSYEKQQGLIIVRHLW